MDDDGDDKDDTKRRTRNLSEKKRRDQFNMLVHELSTMVSTNNRKMDKSTVLKSTISFLKNHNEITVKSRAHDVQEDWKPAFLSNEEFTFLVLEALEGFVMVFAPAGRICYVSESITSLLGHNPADIVNNSIFDLVYEEDRQKLYNVLHINTTSDQIQSSSKDKEMIRFDIHIRRGTTDFKKEATYELVTFNGHFRTNMEQQDNERDMDYQQGTESRVLFICTGRLHTPQLIRDVSLVDSSRNEFTSRHSLEWKFLFLDHRAPPIIGYLPFEVLGTSGYDYYHFDDLERVVTCHEALMQKGELTSCYYRFLTKGQQWIWLQTRFYITYHQWNSKPEFVVCTHRVVSYADVIKTTKEEVGEADTAGEDEINGCVMKEPPPDDTAMVDVSPSYVTEGGETFGGSYHSQSQVASSRPALKDVLSDNTAMASISPSYISEVSVAYAASFRSHSQAEGSRQAVKDDSHSDGDVAMAPLSPSYMSDASGAYGNSYRTHSQPASVKTASAGSTAGTVATASASWSRASQHRFAAGSDNGSVSGESRSSARHSAREPGQGHKAAGGSLAPQHAIGAQYLDPAPYVGAVAVPLPLPPLPVLVTQDHAQMQEQLQRKHEELQQMIVRQQEELRQVKEQLLLARLGILQPLINVPYANPEEMQQPQAQGGVRHVTYEGGTRGMPYPTPHPPQPPHPTHPPHPPGPHQHMPQ